MRVLFVSSGNHGKISALVKNQGDSLIKEGIEINYYLIQGKGLSGYLQNIPKIRKAFREGNYDLVHAHYSLSAYAASIAGRFPLVVSLMGSDIYLSGFGRLIAKMFNRIFWDKTIIKTERMKVLLKLKDVSVIPNGVDLERFNVMSRGIARNKIRVPLNKKLILFLADPTREEKNFDLARKAVKLIENKNTELLAVYNVPNEDIPYYINAADILLITSKWEGSVNVVKEAMACNCPVISTNVGDTKWVLGESENCYVTSFDPVEIADKINLVLASNQRTNGRKRIIDLKLDSGNIAKRINQLYQEVLK